VVGALLLVQQQRLELDADVRQWLRSWKPEEAITLRQVLSHTAGLTVSGFSGYAPGTPLPTTLQILKGDRPANSDAVRIAEQPGKQVRYSGGGYVVVQQLVIDVTQLPFEEYMRRSVLAPLGMTRSFFEQPLSADHARAAASGYRRDGSRIQGNWMVHPELAPAGLWTTPSDIARLMIELQDALAGRATHILQSKWAREMLTGSVDNAGLGVFLAGPNGSSRRFMHSGRNAGFDALMVGYKHGRQGVVVMMNRNNNGKFIDEVIESVAREYAWPDYLGETTQVEYGAVPASIQASYAGEYEAAAKPPLTIFFEDGKLFARSGADVWFRIYPASETEFFTTDNPTRWTFVKSGGRVTGVITRSGAIEVHRQRVR
jgi:CubicO group peptidase (beta-lactamase class C family)